MNTCKFQPSCTFYNDLKERRPALLKSIEEEYCDSNYSTCARFLVYMAQGPMHVSKYLFPEDMLEAYKMLDELN